MTDPSPAPFLRRDKMTKIVALLEGINHCVGRIVCWAALLMVVIQFTIVVFRYVFGISDVAANESVLYLHAALFMLGAGYTLTVDAHVRVDIFYAKASPAKKRLIDSFGHLFLLLPSMGMLLYWSWPSVANSWKIQEGAISVGGIPASFLLKSLIPAFCILLMLQSIACLLINLGRLRAGEQRQ